MLAESTDFDFWFSCWDDKWKITNNKSLSNVRKSEIICVTPLFIYNLTSTASQCRQTMQMIVCVNYNHIHWHRAHVVANCYKTKYIFCQSALSCIEKNTVGQYDRHNDVEKFIIYNVYRKNDFVHRNKCPCATQIERNRQVSKNGLPLFSSWQLTC